MLAWLKPLSLSGRWQLLKRLKLSFKRALRYTYSPDPEFRSKRMAILRAFQEALGTPERVVCLFLDELTYYRNPSEACAYHPSGHSQPRARQAARYNTQTRLVAVLNAENGQVLYLQRKMIGSEALGAFYRRIRQAYPQAEKIYLIQDNWPVHKVPDVLQALQTHGLTPLFLPTYASWLNPIEKLWRWLRQALIHLHPWAVYLDTLRQKVREFLDQFRSGSLELLRYVGLLSD